MLSFNAIPIDLRTPGQYVEFDATRASQGLADKRHRALILCFHPVADVAPVLMPTAAAAVARYGAASMMAGAVTAFRRANPTAELYVQGLAVAGAADVATALAGLGDTPVDTLVPPSADPGVLTQVETFLAARWGPLKMNEGMAYVAVSGVSVGVLSSAGSARNSPHLSFLGMKAAPTPAHELAAAYAGAVSYAGSIDPARPFQTLELPGVAAPAPADLFTRAERDNLLRDGISTTVVDSGGAVRIERAITTYQTNAAGLPDTAYLDVNTMLTLAYLRFTVRARISSKFPRHKLANDGTLTAPGQAVVTPKVIRAELISLFRQWEEAGLVEGMEQFKRDLVVERDPSDPNRVNALIPPDIINQLNVFAGSVQFRL